MRLALIQIGLDARGRSANLTRLLQALVVAAKSEPAPDLAVLPVLWDGPGRAHVSPAMVQGFSESVALVAREWGLYVAAGALHPGEDGPIGAACLFDHDGDVIIRCAAPAEGRTRMVRETTLGRLGLTLHVEGEAPPDLESDCDLLIALGRWEAAACQGDQVHDQLKQQFSALARQLSTTVCAVGPIKAEPADDETLWIGGAALYSPQGRCLAAAEPGEEETILYDLSLDVTGRQTGDLSGG